MKLKPKHKFVAHIISPGGEVNIVRVKGHRALVWNRGIYDITAPFTDESGDQILLISAGCPKPIVQRSDNAQDSYEIADRIISVIVLNKLAGLGSAFRKISVPKWLIMIIVVLLALLIPLMRGGI